MCQPPSASEGDFGRDKSSKVLEPESQTELSNPLPINNPTMLGRHELPLSTQRQKSAERGFTLLELMVVAAIIVVVSAMALPKLMNAMDSIKLREAGTNYSGILQRGRIKAVEDNRYYSVLTTAIGGNLAAYVDTYPQNANGTSGNGAYDSNQREPIAILASGVVVDNVNAPGQANLQNQVVPAGSGVTLTSSTPSSIAFSSRGLPCVPTSGAGSVCIASAGSPVAYATFLKSPQGIWEAVTVTPAGRIQTWLYDGSSTWNKI